MGLPRRVAALLLAVALAATMAPRAARAQVADLQRQIAESRLRLEQIRQERALLQAELEGARTGLQDASRELQNIERQLSASRSVLAELELQLEVASHAAEENSRQLLITRERHQEATAVLHRRLRDVYKLGPLHTARVFLGAESFADLLNRYRYVRMIASYDRSLIGRVAELESELRERNQELQSNMADLGRLRQSRLAEVVELRSVESARQRTLESYRSQEASAESELASLERDERRITGLMDDLEQRRREAENRLAATGRSADASSLAAEDAGLLDWPVEGEVLYRFGPDRRPNGTLLRWNGLGISAPPGTPVRAVRAGTVVLAGPFEGYGPTVVVSHGDGFYTLYLYLEDTGVLQGRRVEKGQVVGTVGGRDTPEGPHIEFQIRAPVPGSGTPQAQDPLQWLRSRPGAAP